MRPLTTSLAVAALLACGSASGGITVAYGPIADRQLRGQLRVARVAENIRTHLSKFAPGATFTLRIADCGSVNAYYASRGSAREARICSELVAYLAEQEDRRGASQRARRAAGGAVLFISGHELGHHLVRSHAVPFLGREEDVADQVGTAVLLGSQVAAEGVIGAINFFSRSPGEQDAGDAHSLDAARRANIACWAFGTDALTFRNVGAFVPGERLAQCHLEAADFWRGVRALRMQASVRPRDR